MKARRLWLLWGGSTTPTTATILLYGTGQQLPSRAASFGMSFDYGLPYEARLQRVQGDDPLCGDTNGTASIPVVPNSDGVPVALLVQRGHCSYETKAQVASTQTVPPGTVRFVIVYNDDPNGGMITMMPERQEELYPNVGLVFVSWKSGLDLKEYLHDQSPTSHEGGPRILIIDEENPWSQSVVAGLVFFIMLLGCIGSLSVVFRTATSFGTREDDDNDVVGRGDTTTRRRTRRPWGRENALWRCLTLEEVETLPTRPYNNHEEDNPSHLELSEKSCQDVRLLLPPHTVPEELPESYGHNLCSICLEEYVVGEHIRVLPCLHTFHSECIFPWLTERSPTCPLCKAMFEAVKYDEERQGQQQIDTRHDESRETPTAAIPPLLEDEPEIHRRHTRPRSTEANLGDVSVPQEGPSSGLRSRLFGFFRLQPTTSPLEEPLLSNDDVDMT